MHIITFKHINKYPISLIPTFYFLEISNKVLKSSVITFDAYISTENVLLKQKIGKDFMCNDTHIRQVI